MSEVQRPKAAPDVDYLTRDYEGFRQLLIAHLDRSASPWRERSAADAGMVLVEILANQLDHLAYAGDAVAVEAFLRTARHRESMRRHAALGDYELSRGSVSHGHQYFELKDGRQKVLLAGARVSPALLPGQNPDKRLIFETRDEARLDARRNRFILERSVVSGAELVRLLAPDGSQPNLAALGVRPGMQLCVRDRDKGEIITVAGVSAHTVELDTPLSQTYLAGSDDRAAYVLGNLVRVRQGKRCGWTKIGRGGVAMGEVLDQVYFERHLDLLRRLQARVEATREEWPVLAPGEPRYAGSFQAGVEAARDEWLELIWMVAAREIRSAVRLLRDKSVLDDSDRARLVARLDEAGKRLMSILTHLGWPIPAELVPTYVDETRPEDGMILTVPGQRVAVTRPDQDQLIVWFSGEPTLQVYTYHDGHFTEWHEVRDFLRSAPADYHYVVMLDNRGQATLCFGDGVNGALLPAGSLVCARWIEGDVQGRDLGPRALIRLVGEAAGDPVVGPPVDCLASDLLADCLTRGVPAECKLSEPGGGELPEPPETWLKATWNPLPTCDASPPEDLRQVPRELRLALQRQVIPVTRSDYAEMLAELPGVAEAVVLNVASGDNRAGQTGDEAASAASQTCPPSCALPVEVTDQDWPASCHNEPEMVPHQSCAATVRVALRADDGVDAQATIRAAQQWADTHRLAGTSVCIRAARDLHATVALIIDIHPEMAVDDVRFRLREAILQRIGGQGTALMGRSRYRAEIYDVAESVPGVAWSRVIEFRRASQPPATLVEVIKPEPDQIVRCVDLPDRPLAGTITIWRAVQYSLDIEVHYPDPDVLPGFGWLRGYLRGLLSGMNSIPRRDGWSELTAEQIDERVLATALGSSSPISLRTRELLRGQRSVQRIPLSQGDIPELNSLRLIPMWQAKAEKRGPCP
ncbi:MAG: hypothetical protein MJE77_19345 [Proteobacteria bacterium]|nr:hypothetical protein [Pseudomonadota bacterium]